MLPLLPPVKYRDAFVDALKEREKREREYLSENMSEKWVELGKGMCEYFTSRGVTGMCFYFVIYWSFAVNFLLMYIAGGSISSSPSSFSGTEVDAYIRSLKSTAMSLCQHLKGGELLSEGRRVEIESIVQDLSSLVGT
jgi:hypothetical protein